MRVAFIGGTRQVGPPSVRLLLKAGHEVCVAHSGAHEAEGLPEVEHLHDSREELLAPGGPVERWRPDALVDTFAGGASAEKGRALVACATRVGARQVVAISSCDVYRHCIEAGLGDASGAVAVPTEAMPLREGVSALRSGPYPGARPGHDNIAMEAAVREFGGSATALRPGTIYGPFLETREATIVDLVRRGVRRLELPDGGVQLFHRVAVERVARAVVAALERAPAGFWECNVVDPTDREYAGLAGAIGRLLDWEWEPVRVPFEEGDHPWLVTHAVLASDERLRTVLGVSEPDPDDALEECVRWLWEQRGELGWPASA